MSCVVGVSAYYPAPYGYATGEEYIAEFHRIENIENTMLRLSQYRALLADKDFCRKVTYEVHANVCWNLALDYCNVAEEAGADNDEQALAYYREAAFWYQQSLSGYQNMVKDVPRHSKSNYSHQREKSASFVEAASEQLSLINKKMEMLKEQRERELVPNKRGTQAMFQVLEPMNTLRLRMSINAAGIKAESMPDIDTLCDQIESITDIPTYHEKDRVYQQLSQSSLFMGDGRSDVADSYWNLGINLRNDCHQKIVELKKRCGCAPEAKATLKNIAQHYQLSSHSLKAAQELYEAHEAKQECGFWSEFSEKKAQNMLRVIETGELGALADYTDESIDMAVKLWDKKRNALDEEQLPLIIKEDNPDRSPSAYRYQTSIFEKNKSKPSQSQPIPDWLVTELQQEAGEDVFYRSKAEQSCTNKALSSERKALFVKISEIKRQRDLSPFRKASKLTKLIKELQSLSLSKQSQQEVNEVKKTNSPQCHKSRRLRERRLLRYSM